MTGGADSGTHDCSTVIDFTFAPSKNVAGTDSSRAGPSGRGDPQRAIRDFAWNRIRKTYATILAAAGNDAVMVSRLLRHSAGGKNMSVAERHYMGRGDALLLHPS